MSNSRKVLSSFGWIALGDWSNRLLGLVTTLVLAKLLSPVDFGAVAIAMIVIQILQLFKDMGVGQALIYRKEHIEQAAGTGLLMVMSVNIPLCLIAMGSAPFVARFYDNPALTPIICVFALNFIWMGLSSVPDALIRKELQFHRLVIPALAPVVVASVVGLFMAFKGYGVWSLVIRTQLNYVLGMVLLWVLTPVRIRFGFDREIARELFGYGKHIVAISVFYVLLDNIDRIYVSKLVSVAAVGYYTLALRIAKMPVTEFSHIVCRIMFPMLTRVNDKPEKLRRSVLGMLRYSSLVSVPMAIGICIFGPSLIHAVYGPRWDPMIPPLQILAVYALFRSQTSLLGETFKAIGRPNLSQRFIILRLVLIGTLGFPLTLWYGANAMCLLLVGTESLTLALQARIVTAALDVPYGSLFRALATPAVAAPVAIGATYVAFRALHLTTALPTLLLGTAVAAGVYAIAVLASDREVLHRVRDMLVPQKAGREAKVMS